MERNNELRQAWEFVEHTGKSIFLTGKAGTGKTTFLKTVRARSHKRMVVVAPTGVAAINAGGVTIHSFFQLPLSPYIPGSRLDQKFTYGKDKRKMMRTIDMLVIDEISMVRSDVLDAIDSVMRRFREHDKPFGGVQLVMIGDLHQLTPVTRPDEEQLLKQYYDTPYFFGSHALQRIDYVTIELRHVYRQEDAGFLAILNDIRDGHATAETLAKLNARCLPDFHPDASEGYIRLTTHNRMADSLNNRELEALRSRAFTFDASIDGDFPEYDDPTDRRLTLKVGAQVMFLKNDSQGRYFNGRIGRVTYVDAHRILVLCPGDTEAIEVEQEIWENTKYRIDDASKQIVADVVGTFSQYPLRLAWAITIHKSQGLTFDRAIIDAQQAFASGQVYVALSRCKTLAGLVLASPIPPSAIISDQRVASYIARQDAEAEASIARLPRLKEEYQRQLLLELFSFRPVVLAEAALDRVMQEFFFGKSPLAALHHSALAELQTQVEPVAAKWTAIIRGLAVEQTHSEAFLDRVRRSAAYFAAQLTDILGDLMKRTALLDTDNKVVRRRLDRAYGDMHDIWLAKCRVLNDVAGKGFSPETYLKYKQEAILAAMDDGAKPSGNGHPKAKAKTAAKPKAPARPKVDSRQVSLSLYQQGKTVEEIAAERNLTTGTIFSHLAHFALRGFLPVSALVPDDHREAITRVIARIGLDEGMKAIKSLCPPDVSYGEISLVAGLAKKQKK